MGAAKRIVFLTGTRADFGKLKSLIESLLERPAFEVHVFATGMHLQKRYGLTVNEIVKCGYPNIFRFINHTSEESMDLTLAKTVQGFSDYCREIKPDLIVVHGDRVEALAGAIVGSLNNIRVAHVEGGEVSGTVDELIRHSVSKLSHVHFVSNEQARARLLQMGEVKESVYVIGSPDIDIMFSDRLPTLQAVKEYYQIPFQDYAILMFHPVTTEIEQLESYADSLVTAVLESGLNYVVIYPNNDLGSSSILRAYRRLEGNERFRVFPSVRFEYFLTLLKHARFALGNSSAGVREAPYYGLPSVNIGTRQYNRAENLDLINVGYAKEEIANGIQRATSQETKPQQPFGTGDSYARFAAALDSESFWAVGPQKHFHDLTT